MNSSRVALFCTHGVLDRKAGDVNRDVIRGIFGQTIRLEGSGLNLKSQSVSF